MADAIEFYAKAVRAMLGLTITRAVQQIQAVGHRWTYQETPDAKTVVIIGGSYAGTWLARRLSETLPTGYRTVLIERNSHFNHLFAFPRYSVVQGREDQASIPYDKMPTFGPPGILQHIRASAVSLTPTQVQLSSGETVDYEYLAIATGSWQPPPSKATSAEKAEACAELQGSQQRIQAAKRIAVIGGGPVGVQIATDIAAYFPDKKVTLVHSRAQLLPNFGPKLHENVVEALKRLNVNMVLGQRPQLGEKGTLSYSDGRKSQYDLVVSKRKSALHIDDQDHDELPTLQIRDSNPNTRVFALGDVAKTDGPRMARAAREQADVITHNILSMINRQTPSTLYSPKIYEGVIKLTLGKKKYIYHGKDENGTEVLINGTDKSDDLNIGHAWEVLGTELPHGPATTPPNTAASKSSKSSVTSA